jgi:hypothetical protein
MEIDFQVCKDVPKSFKKLGLLSTSRIMNRTIIVWFWAFIPYRHYHVEQQQLTSCDNKNSIATRKSLYAYFPFPAHMEPMLMFYCRAKKN